MWIPKTPVPPHSGPLDAGSKCPIRSRAGHRTFVYQPARLGYCLSLLPLLPALGKWSKLTAGQYAQRFRDPLLRLLSTVPVQVLVQIEPLAAPTPVPR